MAAAAAGLELVMVGAGAMVSHDAPPFAMIQGDRAKLVAVNKVSYSVSKEKKSKKEEASRASLLSNISSMIFGFVACCENVPLFLPAHPAHHRRRTLS